MAQFFEMPQASPTMEVGTILSWRKSEGDALAPQDVLAEVETDKAAMEIEIFDDGYLLKILEGEGAEVPAGKPIAILGSSPDEDISELVASYEALKSAPAEAAAPKEEPASETTAPVSPPAPAAPAPTAPAVALKGGLQPVTWEGQDLIEGLMEVPGFVLEEGPSPTNSGRLRASPAARRAARSRGVSLDRVRGTGPRGRVTRADVERSGSGGPTIPTHDSAPTVVKNTQMRKTIARRLKQSWSDIPAFYLTACFDCDNLVALRSQMKDAGTKISYNDLVIKACALALREVPEVNASWGEDAITRHNNVHIGVAVALPDGLITPVVRHADAKDLSSIAAEVRDLAGKAKDRKLEPEQYQGSTFTISNLGMMGIEEFTAIINPPESVILAVGSMQQEAVVDGDGMLGAAWRMRVTLTCDHRVVDGALGAQFLQAVRRFIEQPVRMLL
jgi:pyruvate dehydrogenase E2 component (dihydrolipoamide acetyltransferase)